MKKLDELIQAIVLDALEKHPKGLTEKQIKKIVDKKLKKILKIVDLFNQI